MEWIQDTLGQAARLAPLTITALIAIGLLLFVDHQLRSRWKHRPEVQFRFQLIMLGLTLTGVLAIIFALPVSDALKGDLLGLVGIVLSASIALASTTFIGNMMAGIMLRAIRNARPGDFVTVGDVTGRVTEMGLLRTEVQTEDRDLVTLPNLVLVTQPVKVVRASGTIVSAEVSLGYEIGRGQVSALLLAAAEQAELKEAFVQVRNLGDFAVTYRIAGLLEDVTSLITARSRLRESMLDALHGGGVEIVSPSFMNQRAVEPARRFVPRTVTAGNQGNGVAAEEVAFDKADEAASIEELRTALQEVDEALAERAAGASMDDLQGRRQSLKAQLKAELIRRQAAEP